MKVLKKDGTSAQTRVADLKQITFLTVDKGGQGILVKTVNGETTAVLFETNPVVTASNDKLVFKSSTADPVEFEISDISEIIFGDAADVTSISELKGFACILQDDGILLRGIPNGLKPQVYSLDGCRLLTPPVQNGNLRLSRANLGSGIFIVKAGKFTTKIQL